MRNLKVTLAGGQINFAGELSLHERINLRGISADERATAGNISCYNGKFWGNFCPKTGEWYIKAGVAITDTTPAYVEVGKPSCYGRYSREYTGKTRYHTLWSGYTEASGSLLSGEGEYIASLLSEAGGF